LRRKLWPVDTFVDFEHSLNAAVKRLRDALGESAGTPIFIETLARRGIASLSRSCKMRDRNLRHSKGCQHRVWFPLFWPRLLRRSPPLNEISGRLQFLPRCWSSFLWEYLFGSVGPFLHQKCSTRRKSRGS
jgi:hypothetical protein